MKKFIKELIPYLIIIAVVLLIRTYIISPAMVDGESMEPTLKNGNIVLVNKMNIDVESIKRFDIVVLKDDKELLIKRIIALPNEEVEYKDNILYINGKKLKSNIVFEETEDFKASTKNNEFFVLGDNRDISKDSRYIGNINISDIKGKVNFALLPISKFGKINK